MGFSFSATLQQIKRFVVVQNVKGQTSGHEFAGE